MKNEHHIYTSKRYVLLTINQKLQDLGDWKYFNILIFEHKDSNEAESPQSYEELNELLKDCDKVYGFYEVETLRHGEIAYDIIINE